MLGTVARVRGIERLTGPELYALAVAADTIGTPVDALATVIGFETGGTFSPHIRNAAGSGATGLIQFMPSTARNLGTTTDALAAMSFTEQLAYVVRYFKSFKRDLGTLERLYCCIFWPAAIDQDDDYVIGRAPSKVYTQNAGFDVGHHGYFTRGDICRAVRALRAGADDKARVSIPGIADEGLTDAEKDAILASVATTSFDSLDPVFLDPGPVSGDEDPH